jgi:eukaryotic-like serine/threonine-protein kinase
MTFSAGQTLGGYEFVEVLDTPGFGVSYKVRNLAQDRLESLKALPPDLRGSSHGLERFRREIKIHTRLNHPNVVRFYKAFEIDGQLVITTELPEGISLRQRLGSRCLSLKEGAGYLSAALAGLGYLHEHGVVHRCVHPGNLVIDRHNRVKVAGLSYATTALDPKLTLQGFTIGIADYMAPEQVASSPTLDGRADLYSVGAILYEIATGKPPFPSKSAFETMQAHLHTEPTPPSEINRGLPREVDRVILTSLAKDRTGRFATAEEFQAALAALEPALCEVVAET